MGFFDDVPEPEPPESHGEGFRSPPWAGPPENEIGGPAPVDRVIVNTGEIAVAIGRLIASTTGLVLTLVVRLAPGAGDRPADALARRLRLHDPLEGLRFGAGLSDGRKVIAGSSGDPASGSPVLLPRGGRGYDLGWDQDSWLWPFPPPGELTIAISLPELGPDDRRVVLDAGAILAAADRAVVLWPDDRPAYVDEPFL